MTLKKLCELLNWESLRRWSQVIDKINSLINDINNELNENHRLRNELSNMVRSQSERNDEFFEREKALKELERETREQTKKEKETARIEVDKIKSEYMDTVQANFQHLLLTPTVTDNKVGLMNGGHIIERYWHVPHLDGRYLLYRHRVDGPAGQDIDADGNVIREYWSLFNARHRIDGPAYIDHQEGIRYYYLDGVHYKEVEKWADEVEKRTGTRPNH